MNVLQKLDIMIADMSEIDPKTTPNFKVLIAIKNELHEAGYDHLIRHLGKMEINVNNEFWHDNDLAMRIIHNYVTVIVNISKTLENEFGVINADMLFPDMMKGMTIKYND